MTEQKSDGDKAPPTLPGSGFPVHDGARPQPRIVAPGTTSTQAEPGAPPADAVILFGGTDFTQWMSVHGGAAAWRVEAAIPGCV
jgi:hypothetical protein